jgi:hypothetical protein
MVPLIKSRNPNPLLLSMNVRGRLLASFKVTDVNAKALGSPGGQTSGEKTDRILWVRV